MFTFHITFQFGENANGKKAQTKKHSNMLEEISKLCNKYSIEDLVLKDVEPDIISEKCKKF